MPVRQQVAGERIADVSAMVRDGLQALPLAGQVRRGERIAIAVGSRGISCLRPVVQTLVEALLACEAHPFLVPAMGSHGGGTAEGQRQVLEGYGLVPDELKAPIVSDMATVQIGETDKGMPVYFDRQAVQADGIIAINRIKEHTAFKGRWESGLMKILSVGLGKEAGARTIHNWGVREAMPAAARVVIEKMPLLAGIGIVENGYHEPARVAVLPPECIEEEEAGLLVLARALMPKIPMEPLHLLVVKEMGKDISGTGMDLNVIGMWRRIGGPVAPQFDTIAVLDLTTQSHGNAIGVGHADLISQRLREKIDHQATYTNCLTSHNLAGGKIPVTLPDDRAVLVAGLAGIDPQEARVLFIRNTLDLETFWVSRALAAEAAAMPSLETLGPLRAVAFDGNGNLDWGNL